MASTAIDLLAPVHRFTPAQFLRMDEAGVFDPDVRLELIDGVVVDLVPAGEQHGRAVTALTRTLDRQLDDDTFVSAQAPILLERLACVPQPDLAIVTREDVGAGLPERPLLVVEVAQTTLTFDRVTKARRYAQAGIAEYWIVNLVDGLIEVHREPERGTWGSWTAFHAGQTIDVLDVPGVTVELGPLFAFVTGDAPG